MKLIELQYLPSPAYLALFENKVILEQHENFEKQSYRNRCKILGANGIDQLSIPVKKGNSKQNIREVQIDYTQKWTNRHWRAIQSAYGKAPFFEFYSEEFKTIIYQGHKYLFDLNLDLLTLCLKFLQIDSKWELSSEFRIKDDNNSDDFRSLIHPKKDYSERYSYNPQPYTQLFGKAFVKDLSVLDILFCEGPNARQTIMKGLAH